METISSTHKGKVLLDEHDHKWKRARTVREELILKDTDSNPVPKIHKSLQSHLNQRVEELEAEIEQAKAESEKYRQKFKGVIYYIYYILF